MRSAPVLAQHSAPVAGILVAHADHSRRLRGLAAEDAESSRAMDQLKSSRMMARSRGRGPRAAGASLARASSSDSLSAGIGVLTSFVFALVILQILVHDPARCPYRRCATRSTK
ncbi:hypothetical protein SCP_0600050 [Sparassis crispa]|uniref:Uncharacterized protein n=1 Tax=Sparassis crispa TaxID=139825 RepID=A0A401GP84_9APHY|nr:hypothetical protein SCP_0600050 [Sparassis crispa]GBE84028.1 hypothetical protein SCP_0600050 [Sparassis crispa]